MANSPPLHILLLSAYHGGSHRAWAEGLAAHSQHNVTLLTLPARFWKWRMHGGALTLARQFMASSMQPDVIIVDDMLDLTTFLALTRPRTAHTPVILYMHENQLTYPLPADKTTGPMRRQLGERDRHYAFINLASMAAADQIWFNSRYHQEAWFSALPPFLNHNPEFKEMQLTQQLTARSHVVPVGVDLSWLDNDPPPKKESEPPLILWNQRWEYDKNPEAFFKLLYSLMERELPFQVAICGEQHGKTPTAFTQARQKLSDHLVHFGHADLPTYRQLLHSADLVISSAHHEYFGISIVEAIAAGAFPILPQRLSYPAIIPTDHHPATLYLNDVQMLQQTLTALTNPKLRRRTADSLAQTMRQYNWATLIQTYDHYFEQQKIR